jgi:hypothetical protein
VAIKSHYDVLGVASTATEREIKSAYRAKARRVHPDRVSREKEQSASLEMAELNDAWAVLSDPKRRRQYDDSLRVVREPEVRAEQPFQRDRTSELFAQRPLNTEPARFPWRSMLIFGSIAIVVVLVLSILSDPGSELQPDQLLQSGSCVVVDNDQSVREVLCSEEHYGVVRQLIGFDMRCPGQTEPYRDRQGMGTACVVPVGGGQG